MMMMMGDSLALGVDTGPVSSMNYKRALLRSPPREFTVEVLSPVKNGNNWSYGLKVCPIIRFKRGSDTHSMSSHSSSTSSYSEYEVWRRWEDCLDFQETLEAEYGKMSRQKVKVLKRGAKKREEDSLYTLHNAAASFESLPEGPDPREVVVNVHDLIPPLTRKGTLFRVSRNTVKQRGEEFAAMVRALFDGSEDAPVLLQELRNCTPVRDFFGFWRRDKDLQKKAGKELGNMFHSNRSLSSLPSTPTSPAFSTFSATPTTPTSPTSAFGRYMRPTSRATNDSSPEVGRLASSTPASAPPGNRTFASGFLRASQSAASLRPDRFRPDGGMTGSSIMFTDELLLEDDSGTNAEAAQRCSPITRVPASRSPPICGSRPYEARIARPPTFGVPDSIPEDDLPRPVPRARRSSNAAPEHRNARIFMCDPHTLPLNLDELVHADVQPVKKHPAYGRTASPHTNHQSPDFPSGRPSPTSSQSASPSSRPSSISMTRFSVTSSISSYIHSFSKRSSHDSRQSFESDTSVELDLPFTYSPIVLHTPLSDRPDKPRDSFASFASSRTDSSAEAVIPRHLRMSVTHTGKRSPDSRGDNQTPVMDHQATALSEESMSEGSEDLINSYFDERTVTPNVTIAGLEKELPHFTNHRSKNSISSMSSISSSESPAQWPHEAFAVKALYRDSVIVFRAERSMPLTTIRQRIRDRFDLHESMPLDRDFVLAYLPSRAPVVKAGVMVRSGRSNSVASSTADVSQLRLLESEVDWQSAVTTCGGKVTLRVLDAGAFA